MQQSAGCINVEFLYHIIDIALIILVSIQAALVF